MKVTNRSNETVVYSLPELNIRRVFQPFEHKDISEEELEALFQTDGGYYLIINDLLCEDRTWVTNHFSPPIEYWWEANDIKQCILEDSVDLFSETLDYAPEGVIELIKEFSWKIPLTDLNKVKILENKTGFDVQEAIKVMKSNDSAQVDNNTTPRRRRREA